MFDFGNIGAAPIMVVVLADGSLYQVNTDTKVVTLMAAPGTITNPGITKMGMTQWGSQFIIIVAKQENGFFIWDGVNFYQVRLARPRRHADQHWHGLHQQADRDGLWRGRWRGHLRPYSDLWLCHGRQHHQPRLGLQSP